MFFCCFFRLGFHIVFGGVLGAIFEATWLPKCCPRGPKIELKYDSFGDIAISSFFAPLPSENLIFEVLGVPVEQLFRVKIASKIDVMLEHVSDNDFDRFLMDFGVNLGGYMGPKTGPRRLR